MTVLTVLAATSKSLRKVVVTAPLLLVAAVPLPATATSSGLMVSTPAYSAMRISGVAAAALNATVTVLLLAVAAKMFFA